VVERPVEENITLRDERVKVERRQPNDTTAAPLAGAFEERVVEVRETAEEPVVAKTARVVEEVVVGKEATERTETVKDTVRREEVEVSSGSEMKR
jgi:stress response protein YsnF